MALYLQFAFLGRVVFGSLNFIINPNEIGEIERKKAKRSHIVPFHVVLWLPLPIWLELWLLVFGGLVNPNSD